MRIRSQALSFLILAVAACNQPTAVEECPAGSVFVGRRCLVTCASDLDCLSSEQCDPAVNACRPTGGNNDPDGSIADRTDPGDGGDPFDAGSFDAQRTDLDRPADGGQRADLVVLTRSQLPPAVLLGEELIFDYSIGNEGSEMAPQTMADVYLNPPGQVIRSPRSIVLENRTVPPITGGQEHRFSKRWLVGADVPPGRWSIVVAADVGQRVAESDESNNILSLGEIEVVALTATPNPVDFGTVPIGCLTPGQSVTLSNDGQTPVSFSSIALSANTPGDYRLEMVPGTPRLNPGESLTLVVQYNPLDLGVDLGAISIELSNGLKISIGLRGEGVGNNQTVEHFTQSSQRRADILFIVDDSCSMTEEQTALGSYASGFLNALDQRGIDYGIAVTTTDVDRVNAGEIVGPVIRPNTLDRIVALSTAFNRGIEGSADEAGLEAMYLALTEPRLSGANAGFYRPNAWLAVVIVSDEEDYSLQTTGFYSSFLFTLKSQASRSLISFNGVIGPEPAGCNGAGGVADPGTRYWAVINSTNGLGGSICDANAVRVLDDLGGPNFGLEHVFPLVNTPATPTSLGVTVDGIALPAVNNWVYSPGSNAIIFNRTSVPQPGSAVDVTYDVGCGP